MIMGDDDYGWTDVVGDDSDVEIVMMMMVDDDGNHGILAGMMVMGIFASLSDS